MPSTKVKVVGTSFRDTYPKYLQKLATYSRDRYPKCVLRRDPDNKADPNAVKVVVARRHVGFLPRDTAARVAELMDAGVPVTARIDTVEVYADLPHSPTMTIEINRP